uniref:Transcription elongation factor Eaf N-terminal domain-containing protein n=1 Tax=Aegilops tauschii TaxID=37682 RepID=M8C1U0_AEGTA
MASSNTGEPSMAPQPNRWVKTNIHTDEFKPTSIDKTQAGSLQKSKDNRVTVEFHNNQPGRPKVAFEGSQEEYKDNDGVLFLMTWEEEDTRQ